MRDVAVFDQPLNLRARVVRDLRGQIAIEPQPASSFGVSEFIEARHHAKRGLRGPRAALGGRPAARAGSDTTA